MSKSKKKSSDQSGGGTRALSKKVKTAKGRTLSSTRWLQRQLNDPYVAAAKKDGYRSRAAYKLIEIDDKYNLLKTGMTVLDLGAAPGGWSQVAARRVGAEKGRGRVIALDFTEIEPINSVEFLNCDFMEDEAINLLQKQIDGKTVDAVLSDMAAGATGHKQTDHLRIVGLCEAAFDYSCKILSPGGFFLAKVLQGGTETTLLAAMKQKFKTVRHVKPKASRADSSELYVLATDFKAE